MSNDIINIKDFYNHETRLSLVENAIISIDKKLDQVDKRFEHLEKRFDKIDEEINGMRKELKNDTRWLLTIIAALAGIMAHGFHWF